MKYNTIFLSDKYTIGIISSIIIHLHLDRIRATDKDVNWTIFFKARIFKFISMLRFCFYFHINFSVGKYNLHLLLTCITKTLAYICCGQL
jgi:hypothetical protein